MNVSLIIAAGGRSQRFLKGQKLKRKTTKLLHLLAGKPLLSLTLESFQKIRGIREVLIALPPGIKKQVQSQVLSQCPDLKVRLVRGGATRSESVRNALQKTNPKNDWVMVHDGARPFPPAGEVQKLLLKANGADGIILARPVVPTLKKVSGNGRIMGTIDRNGVFEAETPQLVRRKVLREAYRKNPRALFATDEASLVESIGGRVKVHAHSGWNVKVTTPEDLLVAEAYYLKNAGAGLKPVSPSVTVGFGRDTHRLVEARKFYLGGIRIPFEKGALGHSDGDALLHAVSDALLGAAGLGDIGEWFSDRNPRYKNIRSEKILKKILEETRRKGWRPTHIDSLIILERPKLGIYKKRIRKQLARWLDLDETSVSVKAKTQEGLGPEGEGRAVTCEALVMMEKIQ